MGTKAKAESKSKASKPPVAIPAGCESLLGKAQICAALGVSLRTFQGMVSAGEYPPADTRLGLFPRWRVATHNAWVLTRCSRTRKEG